MIKKNTAEQIQANLQLLSDATTDIKKIVPMYLYIDKRTGRQVKSHLNLKEFTEYLKKLKRDNKKL
jgi:hypothetical protein